jgi:hypothetical protein
LQREQQTLEGMLGQERRRDILRLQSGGRDLLISTTLTNNSDSALYVGTRLGTAVRGAPFINFFVEVRLVGDTTWYPRIESWQDFFGAAPLDENRLLANGFMRLLRAGETYRSSFTVQPRELFPLLMQEPGVEPKPLESGTYQIRMMYIPTPVPGERTFSHPMLWQKLTSNYLTVTVP